MERTYTPQAKLLHWLVALLVLVLLPLGFSMHGFTGQDKAQAIALHKALGITVLTLMVIRVIWRWTHTPPPLPPSMPESEQNAAHLGHYALYALALAMPLSGWAMSSAANKPISFFGLGNVPFIPWLTNLPPDVAKSYAATFASVHEFIAYILLFTIAGHITMAMRHAMIKKDPVLSAMLPESMRSLQPVEAASLQTASLKKGR